MKYNKEKNHNYIKEHIPHDRLEQFMEDIRADQKEEDNAFFNFEGAWELEKKKVRADAIDDFAKYIREKVLFEEKWLMDCKSNNANTNIAFSSIMTFINSVAEELKKVEIQ